MSTFGVYETLRKAHDGMGGVEKSGVAVDECSDETDRDFRFLG